MDTQSSFEPKTIVDQGSLVLGAGAPAAPRHRAMETVAFADLGPFCGLISLQVAWPVGEFPDRSLSK